MFLFENFSVKFPEKIMMIVLVARSLLYIAKGLIIPIRSNLLT